MCVYIHLHVYKCIRERERDAYKSKGANDDSSGVWSQSVRIVLRMSVPRLLATSVSKCSLSYTKGVLRHTALTYDIWLCCMLSARILLCITNTVCILVLYPSFSHLLAIIFSISLPLSLIVRLLLDAFVLSNCSSGIYLSDKTPMRHGRKVVSLRQRIGDET